VTTKEEQASGVNGSGHRNQAKGIMLFSNAMATESTMVKVSAPKKKRGFPHVFRNLLHPIPNQSAGPVSLLPESLYPLSFHPIS
jgi:hypothetical protein